MSNWTHDEVNALTAEFGGGNEAALHIWLYNAPGYGQKYRGGSRPKEGDRIDIFKNFVADCYDKGMFRANTPFVPSDSSASAQSGGESPKPPAVPQPARTKVLQVPKPAETVDFFSTDPEPSFPANSNTSKDPFACGSSFGDASPAPAAHSAFSSTTDLLGAGGGGYGNSSSSNHTSPRFPAPPSAQASLMFDAFNDTPGISPVASFAQFPSSFPPAAPSVTAAPPSALRTGNSFFQLCCQQCNLIVYFPFSLQGLVLTLSKATHSTPVRPPPAPLFPAAAQPGEAPLPSTVSHQLPALRRALIL